MKACFSAYLSCSDASLTASMFPPTTSATMHPCPSSLPDVVDSLLAHAGYSVKASEIAHVAHRLEQLESYLCAAQEAGISHLSSEAVHYNPSDLAGWIECMIGELAPSIGEIKLPTSSQIREGVREFGDFGSSSGLDSSQMERSSYNVGDARNNTTTQIKFVQSGSMETLSHFKETITKQQAAVAVAVAPAPATTISRYGVKDLSGLPLMEQLQEFQYKDGSEDQASPNQISTFYNNAALQAVDLPNTTLPSMLLHQRPYPHQLEQLHHPRLQQNLMNHGAHPSPTSNGTLPFADQIIRPLYQHHGQYHNQFLDSHNGRATYAQQPPPELLPSCMHEEEGAQESGVRLVHLLMACAQAVQKNELAPAHEMVREIRRLASPQSGAMGKVATCFVDALARRIYNVNSHDWQLGSGPGDGFSELLYLHFYETCPYLKFAHFTANQAILEAFEGHKFVHVIDFNLMQGLQWPALIQALALRPGGPPRLRLTGIGPPQPDDKDVLQEIGMKLAQLADSVNVEFDFRGVVASKLDDVKPWMLHVQPGEAVAVNSILQLHRLLYGEPSLSTPIDEVLRYVKSLNPRIITLVEQEGNHNNPCFLDRFMESLQYYCTMFDSLEACSHPPQSSEVAFTEMYLAREIVDIVACEGAARVERHETLAQWRERMSGAGFKPLHLGSNAFKQASMLLTLFSGEGYTVEENNGCLTLGWHSRPLIAASAWQCG